MNWIKKFPADLMEIGLVKNLAKRHYLQFLFLAPALLFFIIAAISIIFGVPHPGFNFGMVFTWVVWWGMVVALFVIIGRGWCVMCPFGALGEWIQRLSFWWKSKWGIGLNFKYPKRLKNLWFAIGFFIVFIFMDNGYGISNSPTLTTGLIFVLVLGAIWVDVIFERRTFCLYHCPITVFIGISAMFAPFEVRRKSSQVCHDCRTKACINGSKKFYGCPMMLRHCDFVIDDQGNPQCHAACPAGVDSDGYINLLAQGKVEEALSLHRETTHLVGTLGRVCPHPCELNCERGQVDGSVSIRSLKRFMADHEVRAGREKTSLVSTRNDCKVAVIGSGPAGLACAYDLIKERYPVTIFEASPQPGGLLRYGIPEYRLPDKVLEDEMSYLKELGVEIKTNTSVKDLDDIHAQGYKAVFLGTGAGTDQKMVIPNEDAKGVFNALEFLKQIRMGVKIELGKRVVVVGGGNAAMDAARAAHRVGGEEVSILYRRSRAEMPAIKSEVEEVEREGIELHLLAAPVRIIAQNGRVTGVKCTRMELGKPDDSGRRRPVPIKGSEFDVPVDNVIVAIGQAVDQTMQPKGLEYTDWGNISVDPVTLQTNIEGVFCGGDAIGPTDVIVAVASGKTAAVSIGRYLTKRDLKKGRLPVKPYKVPEENLKTRTTSGMPMLDLEERSNFSEIALGLDKNAATVEAKRCWNCGYSPFAEGVDRNNNCVLCTECIKACPYDNVGLKVRKWGHDLWARIRGKLDESVGAVVITALVTMVSLFLVMFLPPLKAFLDTILPAGTPPNDWPRIASVGILYLGGVAAALLLTYGFSYLSKLFSGVKDFTTKDFFINFGYALIPLGIMKFLSDILDHVFRTWGAVVDVIRALLLDFPFNRAFPDVVSVEQLMSADQTYVLQVGMVGIGVAGSLYVAYKLAGRMFSDKDIAFKAFLPIGTLVFILSMSALWALSAAL